MKYKVKYEIVSEENLNIEAEGIFKDKFSYFTVNLDSSYNTDVLNYLIRNRNSQFNIKLIPSDT